MRLGIGYNPEYGIGIGPELPGLGLLPILILKDWEDLESLIDALVEFYSENAPTKIEIPEVFLNAFEEEDGEL